MMWNGQHTFDADAIYAIRMVLAGQASAEQAAAVSGLTIEHIHAILAACPQARLQEVESTRR